MSLSKEKSQDDASLKAYKDFWNWFEQHEEKFLQVVKEQNDIQSNFFQILSPKLEDIHPGILYLTGMFDENTAELVLTADGKIKNFIFVEEIVAVAPELDRWRFTAHKPALDIEMVSIEMEGYRFSSENIFFYAHEHEDYPDEIDLTVVHKDLTSENESMIVNGTYIFLDNYLGELNFATTIDNLNVTNASDAPENLIPITKLKDYLIWREKEFVEKYDNQIYNNELDNIIGLEAELQNGKPLFAVINKGLLNWNNKSSHPWILTVDIDYEEETSDGLPSDQTLRLMDEIQEQIDLQLNANNGCLHVGRETADGNRQIFFACRGFRHPSKVMYAIERSFSRQINIHFDLYKDKYWQSFQRFSVAD